MFIVLDTEHILLSLAQLGQTIEDGGLARVLESKHSDDQEVCVVSQVFSNAIAETMILVNQLQSLLQLGLSTSLTH